MFSDNLQTRLSEPEERQRSATEALARAKIPRPVPSAAEIGYYLKSLRDTDPKDPAFRKTLMNHLVNSAAICGITEDNHVPPAKPVV